MYLHSYFVKTTCVILILVLFFMRHCNGLTGLNYDSQVAKKMKEIETDYGVQLTSIEEDEPHKGRRLLSMKTNNEDTDEGTIAKPMSNIDEPKLDLGQTMSKQALTSEPAMRLNSDNKITFKLEFPTDKQENSIGRQGYTTTLSRPTKRLPHLPFVIPNSTFTVRRSTVFKFTTDYIIKNDRFTRITSTTTTLKPKQTKDCSCEHHLHSPATHPLGVSDDGRWKMDEKTYPEFFDTSAEQESSKRLIKDLLLQNKSTNVKTRCSTAKPLPKLDPSYVPTSEETMEHEGSVSSSSEEMSLNGNYLPPDHGHSPKHYIDDP